MSVKIIATISDFGAAANVGGEVDTTSYIIEIPTTNISEEVLKYLRGSEDHTKYKNMSLSLLPEESSNLYICDVCGRGYEKDFTKENFDSDTCLGCWDYK